MPPADRKNIVEAAAFSTDAETASSNRLDPRPDQAMSALQAHGGALDRMRTLFPGVPEPWVDLSTGINPWPWPAAGLRLEGLERLPTEADRARCAEAMAAVFGVSRQAVLVTPGSELPIHLLPTVLRPNRVTVLSPSYGDHARVWRMAGCEVAESAAPLAQAAAGDAVVICNPNNPDGRCFEPQRIEAARRRLSAANGWLIVDEAFADLQPDLSCARRVEAGNLIVLRSMGKFFGLPGLRLGALLGPPDLIGALSARLGFWSVSTPALVIGAAAYADPAWHEQTRQRLAAARQRLDGLLKQRRCRVVGGTDLFRYVQVADAGAVWDRLARQGVYVRRFSWTRRHLRIGIPVDAAAERRLAEAIGG